MSKVELWLDYVSARWIVNAWLSGFLYSFSSAFKCLRLVGVNIVNL